MNCYMHPDRPAVSFCRTCGRALCPSCQHAAMGTVFCPDHVPVPTQQAYGGGYAAGGNGGVRPGDTNASGPNPYAQGQSSFTAGYPPGYTGAAPPVSPVNTSPGLAFILGIIPGVGAIYNGQYVKGLVHAGVFGLLITLLSGNENGATAPLFGILLAAFIFYMPFEAYHTAKRRQLGMVVEEWSSLSRGPLPMVGGRTPIGPILLIAVGVLFLLDTMNLIEFRQIWRFWPVILIGVGAAMLYSRMNPAHMPGPAGSPFPNTGSPYPNPGSPYQAGPMPPPSGMGSNVPPAAAGPGSELVETGRE